MPHFRDVTLENIHSEDAGTAFDVNAAPNAPLEHFVLKNVELKAQHAGRIQHILGWQMQDVRVKANDGSTVKIDDMRETLGKIEN
jgi:hypothetical protein